MPSILVIQSKISSMFSFLLIILLGCTNAQPILPSSFYPDYGNQYGGYAGNPFAATFPGYPFGLTHFGSQSSYGGYNPIFGYNLGGYGGYNRLLNGVYQQGFPSFQQIPLSYDLHGGTNPAVLEHASFLSLVNDKDNFLSNGCGWDAIQQRCTDGLSLCKGGCRDFSTTSSLQAHDCRCIPYGYAALLKAIG